MHSGFIECRPGRLAWRGRPRRTSALVGLAVAILAAPAAAAPLIVSAAASLAQAFNDIGAAFEAGNAGTTLQFNFAASGALLQQIAAGAPVDVLASADEETMDQAERQSLVRPASRVDFASNALVVIVPADAAARPHSLADLDAAPFKRIAIGLPASVPVGRYTKSVLEKAQLWPRIEAKMIGAQSVRQALDYVARGEVDAGFVYATDAALLPGKVAVAFNVPTQTPVRYPAGVLAASTHAAAAQKFVAYLRSAPAQAVLAKYGFGKP